MYVTRVGMFHLFLSFVKILTSFIAPLADCAEGLICQRRDPLDPVPGCIGGDTDVTSTDYCVFDPYGTGYTIPSPEPTNAPSITTARPTLTPLDPQPLMDFGGTPPSDKFPLQLCQGDCEKNDGKTTFWFEDCKSIDL